MTRHFNIDQYRRQQYGLISIYISGVNGNPVYRISFRLGRNYEIRKEYLSTGYENVIILGFLLVNILSKQQKIYIFEEITYISALYSW